MKSTQEIQAQQEAGWIAAIQITLHRHLKKDSSVFGETPEHWIIWQLLRGIVKAVFSQIYPYKHTLTHTEP